MFVSLQADKAQSFIHQPMSKACYRHIHRMHGLNTYDYGARQYNPVTARWDRIDPLAEKYYSISPYAYCAGNPVKYVDPDGKQFVTPSPLLGVADMMAFGRSDVMIADGGKFVKTSTKVSSESSGKTELHHIIPRQIKGMRLVRDAIKAGFRFNGRDNLVRVSKFSRNSGNGQHGNHPKYTEQIKKMIKKHQTILHHRKLLML